MTSQAPQIDKKALGRRRLAARRRRMLRIRQTVVATALSVFIALFSTVYIQMAVGKDPVLAAQSTTASTSSSAASTDESTQLTEPAAVTTTQS